MAGAASLRAPITLPDCHLPVMRSDAVTPTRSSRAMLKISSTFLSEKQTGGNTNRWTDCNTPLARLRSLSMSDLWRYWTVVLLLTSCCCCCCCCLRGGLPLEVGLRFFLLSTYRGRKLGRTFEGGYAHHEKTTTSRSVARPCTLVVETRMTTTTMILLTTRGGTWQAPQPGTRSSRPTACL